MSVKIATSIETGKWYSIIKSLKRNGWKVVSEYNLFDKGIDFDLYELKKNGEKIIFAWDNWFEGEIKCSEERMLSIEKEFNINFKYGEPEHLSIDIIDKMKTLLRR